MWNMIVLLSALIKNKMPGIWKVITTKGNLPQAWKG